ncbi:bifunctional diguanylate cyclase/phosphodiesterase [Thiosocius teredinicola]|uniref:bifunctional diguanylate cyclase/phosphodiesterase n=1 Tax=Thiosocius teredinicola TaxID=1973002 RepID=UPI000990FED9
MDEQREERPQKTPRFVSLKWKVGIVVSVVLIVVNSLIIYVAYRQSNEQFFQQKRDLLHQQQRTISGLLQRDYDLLTSFASFIPLLGDHSQAASEDERLRAVLDRHSALLGLEWGITSLSFFDSSTRLRYAWASNYDREGHARLARQAAETDAPAGRIDCTQNCVLTLAVPQLEGALRGGVLVLSRSIADGILHFQRLSGSEVAVLVQQPRQADSAGQNRQRYLARWQVAVPALSHPAITYDVLQLLQQRYTFDELTDETVFVQLRNQWFACLLGHDRAAGEGTAFLVVSPISNDLAQLDQANRIIVIAGVFGLIATGAILMLFLWKPMNRIRQLVTALPALGRSKFEALRDALPVRSGNIVADEIDVVVDSVQHLADDLETALEARTEAEQNLVWLADHDPLTNLFNRRRFQEIFDRILALGVRYQRTGALLFLDLDQFKFVNDLSGHQAGDALLLLVSSALRDTVRHSDILARLGGDEFALVLPESGAEEAIYMANKLQHEMKLLDFSSSGRMHKVSCSIGITLFPDHGKNLNDLLANADMAMYQAKEAGGGRWHMYSPDELAKELLASRAKWRERINQALIEDAFELHYQPIYDIREHRVTRYETLVRMRDTKGDLVFPDNFIPVAEQSGQIHEIDRWVIRKAIDRITENTKLSLAVNLSGRVLDDPSLLVWFQRQLQESRIDPSNLIVEITETAAVANVQDAISFMREIKALGCRFALDDFGSGFSSFAYLKQLPVDIVKIDGAFIQNLKSSEEDQLFVKALTDVAKGLGKVTVAEFVEDLDTLILLEAFGVDFAQGYHIGRPSPEMAVVL